MAEIVTDAVASLGQTLRARREARGLTREEAAEHARVQLVFVRALEDDDYRLLPDELYLTRFAYEYARFLGLDPAAAEAVFRRQVRREGGVTPLYRAVPHLAVVPWRRLLWIAAAVFPLIPLAFILLSLVGKDRGPAVAPRGREVLPGTPADRMAGPPPSFDATAAQSEAEGTVPAPGAADGTASWPHLLVVRARELTWLAVRVDEGPERELLLREGEMARWRANRGFQVTLGNAAGVDLTLDGRAVSISGRRGDIIRDLSLPSPGGAGEGTARRTPSDASQERKGGTRPPPEADLSRVSGTGTRSYRKSGE